MTKHHWSPKQWIQLNRREKALVTASIELILEQENKERKKAEMEAKLNHK